MSSCGPFQPDLFWDSVPLKWDWLYPAVPTPLPWPLELVASLGQKLNKEELAGEVGLVMDRATSC